MNSHLLDLYKQNQVLANHLNQLTATVTKLRAENQALLRVFKRAGMDASFGQQDGSHDMHESLASAFDEDPMMDVLLPHNGS